MQKLIDQYSKSPDICFGSILIADQSLRTHVDGTTNRNIFEGGFGPYGEAKVCNFERAVVYKNIGNFNISRDYKVLIQVL